MNEDDFLSNYFTFALVVRGELNEINKLKEYISKELYNLKVKYQKISTNPLTIVEGK
jgi:hypothetical protein